MKFPNGSRLTAEDQLRMNERMTEYYLNGCLLVTKEGLRLTEALMWQDLTSS